MTELSIRGSYHPIPSLDEDRKNEEFLASSRDGMGWYDPNTNGLGVLMIDMISGGPSEAKSGEVPFQHHREGHHEVPGGGLEKLKERDMCDTFFCHYRVRQKQP